MSVKEPNILDMLMQNPNQMISKNMIFDEVALALQGSGMRSDADQGKGGVYPEDLRLITCPKLAGFCIKLLDRKAGDYSKCAGAGSKTDHPR